MDGINFGAESVTYELTATGNPGESDQATMTVQVDEEAEAVVILPEFAVIGITVTTGTGRFRAMDGSDNADQSTLGPTGAHYVGWGDGGGFGETGFGDPYRASFGVARYYGHLNRTTLVGWKNAAGATFPEGDNIASSAPNAGVSPPRNTESTFILDPGKSWTPFYVGEIFYFLFVNELNAAILTLYKSTDHGRTWTAVSAVEWNRSTIQNLWSTPAVATAGQSHRAAPDEYLYFLARDIPDEGIDLGHTIFGWDPYQSDNMNLVRVPSAGIETKANWQILSGVDGNNNPSWSTTFTARIGVPGLGGSPNNYKNPQIKGFDYFPALNGYLVTRNTTTFGGAYTDTIIPNLEWLWSRLPWGPYTLIGSAPNFQPAGADAGSSRTLFSYNFPTGEMLQPQLQGSVWKLPCIFAFSGVGYFDAFLATQAELTLSLTAGNAGIIDGGARHFGGTFTTSHTIAINIGKGVGNKRAVLANFACGEFTPTSVTLNGASMTLVEAATSSPTTTTKVRSYILLDASLPPTAGSYNIMVTFGTADVLYGQVYSVHGVAQEAPVAVVANSTVDSTLNALTLPSLQAADKGALVFTAFGCGEERGCYLNTQGFQLDYYDNGGVPGDAWGFGHILETADTPPARTIRWETRDKVFGTLQVTNRLAALAVVLEPSGV